MDLKLKFYQKYLGLQNFIFILFWSIFGFKKCLYKSSVLFCVKVALMGLDKGSNRIGVGDYFVNPINNKTALQCYGDIDNADYSGFDSNLCKYLNEKSISEMIKVNSEINRILARFKIAIKINKKILNNLMRNHLPQTRDIALGITKYLPQNLKRSINRKALVEATSLHDIAKVIIPETIINKPGKLTDDEREIMNEHAKLSYEMLKSTDLDSETLDLIKNHHHSHDSADNLEHHSLENINLQILSIADIYSALREKRSYKTEMSKEQALKILNKETQQGKFHPSVYEALVEYSNRDEKSNKRDFKWQIFNLKATNSLSS